MMVSGLNGVRARDEEGIGDEETDPPVIDPAASCKGRGPWV